MADEEIELRQKFADLPDDCIADIKTSAAAWGVSRWTYRRNPPVPIIQISEHRLGSRVGDLRARMRGHTVQPV
jgi:hypothetical protein